MARRKAKTANAAAETTPPPPPPAAKPGKGRGAPPAPPGTDLLSQTVLLCQEQRWREAALVCQRLLDRARHDGNVDLEQSMTMAMVKIEYSLRRQMAAAAVDATRQLVAKEFLLDVGA
jgi:hypothetical protein